MARSIRSTRSSRQDEGTKQRNVVDQPTPFVGLLLAPFAAMLLTWIAHFAIRGFTFGQWHLPGSNAYMGLAVVIATLGAVAIATAAWHFSYDRQYVWRIGLTASAALIGLWLPVLIWVGPHRWVAVFFVLTTYIFSGIWAMPRLHVLRRDPREAEQGGGEDDLMRELGLKGFKFGTPNIEYDENGDERRRVYDVKHRLGATRRVLTDALPNMESLVGGPEGLSRVTKPDDGKSNRSVLTLMMTDPLVSRVPYHGPSRPGGSITDPALIGNYDDGDPVYVWIAGGFIPDKPLHRDGKGNIVGQKIPPTGYAFMGMTRAGKTVGENRLLVDGVITRSDAVICYFNKSKGDQDVAPIIDGVEVAILADDVGAYQVGLNQIKAILSYRQRELGRYGISAWSADRCYHNPPTHMVDGTPQPMKPMPALVVHVGEADAILESSGEQAVYLASKGLSVGILCGWSLQRWSAYSMPTDLRFNIGCRFCYGIGDEISATFALSDQTIAAGAHPENWKNFKPGRFFVEGAGIDDNRWPVSAKTIGDEDDDALIANMRRDCAEWGPRMAKLDEGSAVATRGWWQRAAAETVALRARLTGGPVPASPAATTPPTPHPAAPPPDPTPPDQEEEMPRTRAHAGTVRQFDASPPTATQDADAMDLDQATRADIASTTEVNGRTIRGEMVRPERGPDGEQDDSLFDEMARVDPRQPVPPPGDEDDGIDLTEPKPEAATRAEAELALDAALRGIAADPAFADPDDPTGRTILVRTHQIQERYPFRTRTWYSPMLAALANGERLCPPGLRVEKAPDRRGEGWYRIIRTTDEPLPDEHSE